MLAPPGLHALVLRRAIYPVTSWDQVNRQRVPACVLPFVRLWVSLLGGGKYIYIYIYIYTYSNCITIVIIIIIGARGLAGHEVFLGPRRHGDQG